jgi:hypothetical protein
LIGSEGRRYNVFENIFENDAWEDSVENPDFFSLVEFGFW